MDPLTLDPYLETETMGRILEVHASIASTNDRARELARAGARHGTTVVASAQTEGRGQRGRTWHSPSGLGLYVSFVLRPKIPPRMSPALPLLAGVALREAIARVSGCECDVRIKWPNDLLAGSGPHQGRKVAGILVELSASISEIEYAVLGIGVNLVGAEFPPEIRVRAVSLEALSGRRPEPGEVLGRLATTLEARLLEAERDGFDPILDAWRSGAAGIGERVELAFEDSTIPGTFVGVADDGALLLKTEDEHRRRFYGGRLRFSDSARGGGMNERGRGE